MDMFIMDKLIKRGKSMELEGVNIQISLYLSASGIMITWMGMEDLFRMMEVIILGCLRIIRVMVTENMLKVMGKLNREFGKMMNLNVNDWIYIYYY